MFSVSSYRSLADPQASGLSDRSAYSRGRSEIPSKESRYADDGRRPDHHFNRGTYAALDRPPEPVCLGGAVRRLSFGAIGFYDDYTKVRKKHNLGLTARQKFGLQVVACLAVGMMLLCPSREKCV